MKLEGLKDAEAWSGSALLPIGWSVVEITKADEGKSSGGHDQIELEFEGSAGSILDWLVITPNTIGKVASLLDSASVERTDDLDPSTLLGKKIAVFCADEPRQDDPTKMRRRVQVYAEPDQAAKSASEPESANGSGADADLPF